MNRRDLILRLFEIVVALPIASLMGACGNKDSTSGDLTVTSSSNGHTHTFTVPEAKLTSPPSAGYSGEDSSSGHRHTVSLTQAQLTTINGGGSVSVESSSADGHQHTYTFRKS